ncbi:MAG: hypothetical protein QNJ55_03515 [Xenococcus sp. MO_188.B8]|nr:hypothetical protein [Xenococcus sp. MO_188.B8]
MFSICCRWQALSVGCSSETSSATGEIRDWEAHDCNNMSAFPIPNSQPLAALPPA